MVIKIFEISCNKIMKFITIGACAVLWWGAGWEMFPFPPDPNFDFLGKVPIQGKVIPGKSLSDLTGFAFCSQFTVCICNIKASDPEKWA